MDYFSPFELPMTLWATMASLGMDGRILMASNLQEETWFAVEQKFGDNNYREALTMLLELEQTETLDTYISVFEDCNIN